MPYWPRTVLARDLLPRHRDERAQHLHLLVADRLRLERRGRLHRDETEELEHVVLHHVAHRAGAVVVGAAAALHAELLADRDLHVVDVLLVEERLEDRVAEAEAQDVLDGLFPEVVVDAVDLALVERRADDRVQGPGALEVGAERLLDDDARPRGVGALADQACGGEVLEDEREELGSDRQVEETVPGEPALLLDRLEAGLQARETSPGCRRRRPGSSSAWTIG